MPDPNTLTGDDSRPDTRPVYCYAITQLGVVDTPTIFLTSYNGQVDIAGLPARYDADEPQAFLPGNITHGPITRESSFDKSTFTIKALTRDIAGIARYAMTGALPRIQVDVIKVNPGRVINGDVAEWGEDTILVQTGLMASFGYQGHSIEVECVPEPLFSGHEIPRWRFSRTCNHQLYSAGCGVSGAAFQLAGNIVSLNPSKRSLILNAQHPSEGTSAYFRQGVLIHQKTGLRFSIFNSSMAPPGSRTSVQLHQWNPDFAINDVVVLRAGCRHTFADCKDKFSNAENFGGFTGIPNKNPSYHGV